MKSRSRRTLSTLAAAASCVLFVSGPAGTATAAATVAARTRATPGAPQYLSVPDRLYGAAASSASDVWAVGLSPDSSLIMHWNGRGWSLSYTEPVGYFLGVAAVSARSAWAVGGTNWFSPSQPLVERWNGRIWSMVPAPSPGEGGYFNDVAATSASNAWAVGLIGPGGPGSPGSTVPLIEHWNGRNWRQQRFRLPVNSGGFNAVAATGPDNAWAVGGTGNGGPNGALIEHWNGRTWKRLPAGTPNGRGYLSGVTAIGPDDAWAVGYNDNTTPFKSLILHWNGSRWSVVRSPNPTGDTSLRAVTATGPDNAWTVGLTNPTTCSPQCQTVIFQWNGKRWSVVPSPNPPAQYLNALLGIVAISARDAWAVGTTDYASTLITHWNGKTWK